MKKIIYFFLTIFILVNSNIYAKDANSEELSQNFSYDEKVKFLKNTIGTLQYKKIGIIPDTIVKSSNNKYLLVYGQPEKINRQYPQTTKISLIELNKGKFIKNYVYTIGYGVYEASFDKENKYVILEANFTYKIDLKTKK